MNQKQFIKDYNQMIAHLNLANEHQRLATEMAARLGVLLGPVQDPAPIRGKTVLTEELKAKMIAKRRRLYLKYEQIPIQKV